MLGQHFLKSVPEKNCLWPKPNVLKCTLGLVKKWLTQTGLQIWLQGAQTVDGWKAGLVQIQPWLGQKWFTQADFEYSYRVSKINSWEAGLVQIQPWLSQRWFTQVDFNMATGCPKSIAGKQGWFKYSPGLAKNGSLKQTSGMAAECPKLMAEKVYQ